MSRRRIKHGKAARVIVAGQSQSGAKWSYAVRGNVEQWRAERGIRPRGLRPKQKDEAKHAA